MLDPWERPFARYDFRYRHKDGLIKQGIIPEPSLEEQVAQMSDGKRKEALLKALKREKEEIETVRDIKTIKRERDESDDDSKNDPRRCHTNQHKRTRRVSCTEILKSEGDGEDEDTLVDLTGDTG
ncbi:uncharacterized protein QC761_0029530 [Podospora bellae-mahoneyi]|uniref:Uncharacterized protein n=1 Tax=Podospora bellae-mahoneyi TaxID=2093777 RepID=A0ABR0FSM2_9PEZI|nr:hypothetical protein QC761_0029530 [Podospora bellae-mahoneyi]